MTEEAALLAAIFAQREDDTARLVYADFLDGDATPRQPERAAFIRAQVRRELCGVTPRQFRKWFAPWFARFDLLQVEGRIECRPKLRQRVEADLPMIEATRGFISTVYCVSDDWLEYGDDIYKRQPLQTVWMSDYPAWDDGPPGRSIPGQLRHMWPKVKFRLLPAEMPIPTDGGNLRRL